MIDREKVIKGLTVCTKPGTRGCFYDIKECPYDNNGCRMALMRDALALLNEDCHNCKLECLLQKYDELKEKYDALLKEKPEIVLCKDCKHRPKEPNFETYKSGFDIEFPEGSKCPCQCEDGWYSWYPNDRWFCANGERR